MHDLQTPRFEQAMTTILQQGPRNVSHDTVERYRRTLPKQLHWLISYPDAIQALADDAKDLAQEVPTDHTLAQQPVAAGQ